MGEESESFALAGNENDGSKNAKRNWGKAKSLSLAAKSVRALGKASARGAKKAALNLEERARKKQAEMAERFLAAMEEATNLQQKDGVEIERARRIKRFRAHEDDQSFRAKVENWSDRWFEVTNHRVFDVGVLIVICIACLTVGLSTYKALADNPILKALELGFFVVFSFEFLVKLLAEGMEPWRYFSGKGSKIDSQLLVY
jgi:hypothetical protein